MSKGVKTMKPKGTKPNEVQKNVEPHANLSILELMDHLTNTTEELQEVIRRIDDLNEDTVQWRTDLVNLNKNYLEQKAGLEEHLKQIEQLVQAGLEEHLKKVEQLVLKKKFLSTELAGYSDAFKNRMD